MSDNRRITRGVVIGALGCALALAAFGVGNALASSGSSGGTPHGPAAASTAGSNATALGSAPAGQQRAARLRRWYLRGRWMRALFDRVEVGKVTAVSSGSVELATLHRGLQTVDTTSSTRYFDMVSRASASVLKVGERVVVLLAPGTTSSSGSAAVRDAAAVVVLEPFTAGRVVSVSSSLIVVQNVGGLERDIAVSGATVYSERGTTVGASAVKPGDRILAYGSVGADPTALVASHVIIGDRGHMPVARVAGGATTVFPAMPGGSGGLFPGGLFFASGFLGGGGPGGLLGALLGG